MERIGLIAGNGRFPILFADLIKSQGIEIIAVAHSGETLQELEKHVHKIFWIKVGQLGSLIKIFKNEHIQNVVMAGGIKKTRLFTDVLPDLRAIRLLSSIKEKKDDAILRAVAADLEKEGLTIKDSTQYLSSLLVEEGPITIRKPTPREWEDIEFGWKIGKSIGRLDIGQSIVVKDKVVLAVEAIEGTDEAIKRGGRLAEESAIVVKICKPGQDLRFDLPTVGPGTIQSMAAVKASILAVEAGKTLLLDRAETIHTAEKKGIGIIGIRYD